MIAPTNADLDQLAIANDARVGERMLQEVFTFLGRFVSYPSERAQTAHALWCVHAHMMDKWESTPRLAFLSAEPASGKTRALEITELLVPSPVTAVNMSPSYLFRRVGEGRSATMLYDEIDTVFGPKAKENEEIRGLLNAGHRKGAVAGRCAVKGKEITTEEIQAYSAVALAGLGWLPETLLSRSVIIRMRRRRAGEVVEPYRRRIHLPDGERVRGLIERWTATANPDWPKLPPEIQDRDADVWEPLVAIADAAGGVWPEKARVAAVALVALSREAEPSLGIRLLTDLKLIFENSEKLATKEVLSRLSALEESPWGDLRGKPLDERGLARRLAAYSIRSTQVRIGESVMRGYRREDLHDAWERYLPSASGTSATSATSATSQETGASDVAPVAPVADLSEANGEEQQCWHCCRYGETLQVSYGDTQPWLHRECIKPWVADYDGRNLEIPEFLDRRVAG